MPIIPKTQLSESYGTVPNYARQQMIPANWNVGNSIGSGIAKGVEGIAVAGGKYAMAIAERNQRIQAAEDSLSAEKAMTNQQLAFDELQQRMRDNPNEYDSFMEWFDDTEAKVREMNADIVSGINDRTARERANLRLSAASNECMMKVSGIRAQAVATEAKKQFEEGIRNCVDIGNYAEANIQVDEAEAVGVFSRAQAQGMRDMISESAIVAGVRMDIEASPAVARDILEARNDDGTYSSYSGEDGILSEKTRNALVDECRIAMNRNADDLSIRVQAMARGGEDVQVGEIDAMVEQGLVDESRGSLYRATVEGIVRRRDEDRMKAEMAEKARDEAVRKARDEAQSKVYADAEKALERRKKIELQAKIENEYGAIYDAIKYQDMDGWPSDDPARLGELYGRIADRITSASAMLGKERVNFLMSVLRESSYPTDRDNESLLKTHLKSSYGTFEDSFRNMTKNRSVFLDGETGRDAKYYFSRKMDEWIYANNGRATGTPQALDEYAKGVLNEILSMKLDLLNQSIADFEDSAGRRNQAPGYSVMGPGIKWRYDANGDKEYDVDGKGFKKAEKR